MTNSKTLLKAVRGAAGAVLALVFAVATPAATFEIINIDGVGTGFNDATPVAPVGGNAGTTLGEQRQLVFKKVAEIWGQNLRSDVPIRVLATFSPLTCSATNGALGGALAWNQLTDFPNAERPNTWYPAALANKLAGVTLLEDPDPLVSADILAIFNSEIGKPGCLEGSSFYLGRRVARVRPRSGLCHLHQFRHRPARRGRGRRA
jgi:hypothetical protein